MSYQLLLLILFASVCVAEIKEHNDIQFDLNGRSGRLFHLTRSPMHSRYRNPNYQVVQRLLNPNHLIAQPYQRFSGRLPSPFSFLNRFTGFGKFFRFFKATTMKTTTTVTTTPATTTTIRPAVRYVKTCDEALTICPLGTAPKAIETEEELAGLNIFGGNIYAGAATGVANSPGTGNGASFTFPSGNVISSTDTDSRWDPALTSDNREDEERTCLFWENDDDVEKLRTRQQTLDGKIVVVCE